MVECEKKRVMTVNMYAGSLQRLGSQGWYQWPVIRWLNIPSIIAFTSFSIFLFNPMFFNFLTDSVRLSAAPNQQSQQEEGCWKVERAVLCDRPERDIRVRIYKVSLWTDLVSPSETPARLLVQSVVYWQWFRTNSSGYVAYAQAQRLKRSRGSGRRTRTVNFL
jgi:hypothetical protein